MLAGHGITLEELRDDHVDELAPILDDEIWRFQPIEPGPLPSTPDEHRAWLERWFVAARSGIAARTEQVFVVRTDAGKVVGSTRYLAIVPAHRRREIGGTFYAADARATLVNAACKRLLLSHAFDELGCHRVELKCDARNARSIAAITKLGAEREGVFRRHMVLGDGHVRDTVYFSIVDHEWPTIRAGLDRRLERT